jgi:isocitrate/isopropylmalate dehydrogenase
MRYAFDLARTRNHHVTSATKSNGIIHTMPFWDERFAASDSIGDWAEFHLPDHQRNRMNPRPISPRENFSR